VGGGIVEGKLNTGRRMRGVDVGKSHREKKEKKEEGGKSAQGLGDRGAPVEQRARVSVPPRAGKVFKDNFILV